MKEIRVYDVIFPVWLMLLFPPVIFITLMGNFLVDSLVLVICYYAFRLAPTTGGGLKSFYLGNVFLVWGFGLAADLVGAALMFVIVTNGDLLGFSAKVVGEVAVNPFASPAAAALAVFAMLVSGAAIFVLNDLVTFRRRIPDRRQRITTALLLAVVTMPWTFLLPTQWFMR